MTVAHDPSKSAWRLRFVLNATVSVLYAVSMQGTVLLLFTLLVPLILQVYMASRISERSMPEGMSEGQSTQTPRADEGQTDAPDPYP
jgi:hypothetical protein